MFLTGNFIKSWEITSLQKSAPSHFELVNISETRRPESVLCAHVGAPITGSNWNVHS